MPAQNSKKTYSISELSKILQVSDQVIRRWERSYNINTERNEKGHRVYANFDLQHFLKIQKGLNSRRNIEKKLAYKKASNIIKKYLRVNKGIVLATSGTMFLLFILALQFNADVRNKLQPLVLSLAREKVTETVETQRVLGARDRLTNFIFRINVPTNLGSTLTVEEDTTIEGELFVPTINAVTTIDLVTKTTLEETLELGGDFAGTLTNVTLAPGSVEGPSLADELDYEGTFNIEGVLQAAGEEGDDGQLLSSTGDGVEWVDADDDADTLDSIDSTAFLRSNTSDSFTGGTLDFSDGTFLDLSAILHNDTAVQGLRLPQATSLSAPTSGEGYLAYDTDDDGVYYYNGTAWTSFSSTLQGAYDTGSTIQMTAGNGDIQIYNDSAAQILFLDEDTARVGIGNVAPAYKLDVSGDVNVASGSDVYIEGEALRTTALGDRQYTDDAFVIDGQTFTASIDALDQQVEDLTLGTAGLWTDAGSLIYLVDTTDDFVLGGTTLANSIFSIDESAGVFLFGGDNSVDPTLRFEASDSSVGDFGFNANDAFHIQYANLGIGTTNPGYALDVNGDFNANTLYVGGVLVSSTPAELNILDGATVSTTEVNLLSGRTGALVDSNNVTAYATTAVDSGSGLTGGGTVGNLTVNVGAGSGISVAADSVGLGALTSSWNQTGGFDIFLNNASSELKILESTGATFSGLLDVGDLSADRTYTFPDTTGTVLVDENAATELSAWDQDASDDHTGTGTSGQVTYWTGTYAQDGTNNLFWDNSNSSLGIGTSAPSSYLDVRAATTSRPSVSIASGSTPSSPSAGDIYADGTNIYWYNGATWDDLTDGGGGLFTDGGDTSYLTSLTDNLAIGGTAPSLSIFAIEESTGNFYFASDNSANPTFNFEATDSDAGLFGFNTNDSFYFSGANVGIGTTNPASEFDVVGDITVSGTVDGKDIATNAAFLNEAETITGNWVNTTNPWADNEVSDTLTVGTSGSVADAALSANVSLLAQTIEGSEITDNTIEEADLELTNSPTDNYILSYDLTSGGFTWVVNDGGVGASKWTDGGTTTYLTSTTDDLGIGGTGSSSELFFDTSASALTLNPFGTSSGNTGEIRFSELVANGSNYSGFKAPDSLASNIIYSLPNTNGTSDYVLTWQTGNVMEWKAVTGIGGAGDITAVGSTVSGDAFADATADDDWLGLGVSAGRIQFDDQVTDEVNILDAYLGVGTSTPASALDVVGNITVSGTVDGKDIATNAAFLNEAETISANWVNTTNPWADNEVSDTLTIGASGSVNDSALSANVSLLAQTIEGSEITDNTIEEVDLELTNAPTDNYLLTYDSASAGFTWIDPTTVGAVDGSGIASYVARWSDTNTLTTGVLSDTGTNVGIGTTAPSETLHVVGDFMSTDNTYVGSNSETLANTGFVIDGDDLFVAGMAGIEGNIYTDGSFIAGASTTYGNGSITQSSGETLTIGTTSALLSLTTTTAGDIQLNPGGTGNVAIGTGSDAFLDIKAATTGDAQVNFTSSSGTDVSVPVSGDLWWNGTNLYFYDGAASTDLIAGGGTFDGTGVANYIVKFTDVDTLETSELYELGGNIGIGTTAPASKLEVAGTFTATTSVSTPLLSLSGTGTLNGLDAVDSTTENTIESLIFDTDAENITGVWEVQDNTQFNFGDESDFTLMYDETTNDEFQISDGTNSFFTLSDQGSTAIARINGDDIYVESTGNVGIGTTDPTEALHVNGDIRIEGGELYFDPLATSSSTTEGTVYYDSDVDHLYLYGGDSAFHRIALDMTKYTGTDTTVPNQSYVQIAHNQGTNDLAVVGWFYNTITSLWEKITGTETETLEFDTDNEFNPGYKQKVKTSQASLAYDNTDLGDGDDGAITVNANTNINTVNLISGRTCTDGGDAVYYNATALTSNTATLNSTPSTGCLAAGDEILLINLQGTTSAYGNVGNWETLIIESISTNTLTFTTDKQKYYGDGASDDTNIGTGAGTQKVLVQRIPNYTTVTVNASYDFEPDDWDGTGGGVMFFRATGAVSISGDIDVQGKGYRRGIAATGPDSDGADGGESFCSPSNGYGVSSAGGSGGYNAADAASTNNNCGGGGGGGGNSNGAAGASGSLTGGAGGGGGGGESSNYGRGGGGGAGGYGTAGQGGDGSNGNPGSNGGTNTSGAGGNNSVSTYHYGAGGGGGGTYGDAALDDLFLGSGGAAGGAGENNGSARDGGHGGDGGGIIYIAGNSITVSGTVDADGNNGSNGDTTNCSSWGGSGGGGGAGGSVKLVGTTITLGSSIVTASGGTGATGCIDGGDAGDGRIAANYVTSITGSTSPTYNSGTVGYNEYAVYFSEEIETPATTAFNNIQWTETLDTNGEIQVQTRSGSTADATDGTWEAWKPTTSSATLNSGNTHTDWSGSNMTIAEGDVLRNVDNYEDEDESDAGNLTKMTTTAANGYGEDTIGSTNISSYDYITFWVRATSSGETVKFGFGEAAATEQEQTISINFTNTWQKVYWDISDITGTSRDGVTKLRFTGLQDGMSLWIDDLKAESYLTTPGGSTVTSTADEYIQYRAILTTTNTQNNPTISKVEINLTNPQDGTLDIDADRVRNPNDIKKPQLARAIDPEILNYSQYSLGDGGDGAVTINANTNINTTNTIAGRSCVDGGDAVNYNVSTLTSTTATLSSTPSSGCLSIGDEVLLINLQGTTGAYVNVGNWETLRVQSVSGTLVTFTSAKTKYYGDGAANDSNLGTTNGTQRVMLQRVPNYTNLTVSATYDFYPSDWNGSKGGVMFFRANGSATISGDIDVQGKGYRRGIAATGPDSDGADGGESFCSISQGYGSSSAGGAGGYNAGDAASTNNNCGGGGGGGGNSNGAAGASGTATGGAGGGGGGGESSNYGRGGGGGAGGYGTAGQGGDGSNGNPGTNGGTNVSGNGGNNSVATYHYGGGGGGGGTYGDANLEDLFFGSGGAAGGAGENNGSPRDGGHGGDGGGIVYIAANSISVSGTIDADGNGGSNGDTTNCSSWGGSGGGGGAGGSIKVVGNSLTLGTSLVTASGGTGATGCIDGGDAGAGRIATYAITSISGTSSPTYTTDTSVGNYNPYEVLISQEISTSGATSYSNIEWTENLPTNTEIQFQTRSGNSTDSTDGTWEAWKPTTSSTTLSDANTHTEFVGTNATVADGDVTRDVNYYEDEDEATSGNLTKITTTAADGFAEDTITSTDISTYDYITFWIRSDTAGDVATIGIGEAAATEQTQDVTINDTGVWQKVYWDISDITGTARDGITKLRFTFGTNGAVSYIDNIKAESYLTTPGGSSITSTANNYIQYRAILSTTDSTATPTLSEVAINYNDGSAQTVYDRTYNQNTIDQYIRDLNLRVIEDDLINDKETNIYKNPDSFTIDSGVDTGTGADGDITISSTTNMNDSDVISGRSCADGGDMVNYNVTALTSSTATLEKAPSTGCLNIGDEILLINLQGSISAFGNVGNWETLRISAIDNNVLTFSTDKAKYYGDNSNDDSNLGTTTGTQRVMLQRVPNYEDVTVGATYDMTVDDWDGSKGGVIFFRASGAVSISGNIDVQGKGYRRGIAATGPDSDGADGGESFCSPSTGYGTEGAGGAGGYNAADAAASNNNCGGGGGGGGNSNNAAGASGSLTGGAGGGGGGGESSNYGRGGGGGAGGYGTPGQGGDGSNGNPGTIGGTNASGAGGNNSVSTYAYGAGGGGGGTYGDSGLEDLFFGSGGAAGGAGENNGSARDGGHGGDGGGIVQIIANIISVAGTVDADGNGGSNGDTTNCSSWGGSGGGGGAGGSVKLLGNTLTIGSSIVTATGGTGATGCIDGGNGGNGRVAIYYSTNLSGSTSPTAQSAELPTKPYAVFVSDEFKTPDSIDLGRISWNADEDSFGNVQLQMRTGKTSNSTDNTWEAWKPITATTNTVTINDADTHGDWVESESTVTIADGDVTRDINFFEDEDELTSGDLTKITFGANSDEYAETVFGALDLTSYDVVTAWVRASTAGNVIKLGMGETSATEHEQLFHIDATDTWQKIYWDISRLPDHEVDGIRNFRITGTDTSYDVYIDNITAEVYYNDPDGTNITSTPDEYIQYRAIVTTSITGRKPTIYNVALAWDNGYKIEQTNNNTVRLYNYTGDTQNLRLEAIVFGADLAEWYTVNDQIIEPGDLVALTGKLDDYGVPILRKTNKLNDPDLVGAISTKAGKELGIEAENRRLLALAGRVPVKIDETSLDIKAGDSITSGPGRGTAKKAEVGERAIGRALEDWNKGSDKKDILVLVAPGYTHGTDIVATKVGDIEEKVSTISTLLGLEGTEGSSGTILEGLTQAASDMANTFTSFQTYVDGLGLTLTENDIGDTMLAVNSDFAVTGEASLGDTTVTGDLRVGQVSIDPVVNSIDVLGASCVNTDIQWHNEALCDAQTLYLQKNRTGNVDIFDGAITITPNGTIIVDESIEVSEVIITTEGTGSDTVGTIVIESGNSVGTVETTALTEKSRIFTTPERPVPVGVQIIGEQTFHILISPQGEDLKVDWWLINEEQK